jgi:hypothetical protein
MEETAACPDAVFGKNRTSEAIPFKGQSQIGHR